MKNTGRVESDVDPAAAGTGWARGQCGDEAGSSVPRLEVKDLGRLRCVHASYPKKP